MVPKIRMASIFTILTSENEFVDSMNRVSKDHVQITYAHKPFKITDNIDKDCKYL